MIPGGTAVVHTRKPMETGKTMWAMVFDVLNGIMSYSGCGCGASDRLYMGRRFRCGWVSLSDLFQLFFSVSIMIPVSFVMLTVPMGGLLRWGVVDLTIRPGEDRQSWLQQGGNLFYSALYWTQRGPGGFHPVPFCEALLLLKIVLTQFKNRPG